MAEFSSGRFTGTYWTNTGSEPLGEFASEVFPEMSMKRRWPVMPEEHALRNFHWQLFITLTFTSDQLKPGSRRVLMFSWLRDVAGSVPQTHFRKLLWVSRFERGRGLRGHFHLCIAG